jgi:hypothetical protein
MRGLGERRAREDGDLRLSIEHDGTLTLGRSYFNERAASGSELGQLPQPRSVREQAKELVIVGVTETKRAADGDSPGRDPRFRDAAEDDRAFSGAWPVRHVPQPAVGCYHHPLVA